MMNNKNYTLQSRIGKGATSKVYKAFDLRTGTAVAIKRINLSELEAKCQKASQLIAQEIELLARCKHRYVNEILDDFREIHNGQEIVFIVLELCEETLVEYLGRKPGNCLPEKEALHVMKQLASAFFFLRNLGIIHRDIKPANILIKMEDGEPIIKISDFGFARHLADYDTASTHVGTSLYMAPEIAYNQPYSPNADLYSIGALLYHILTGNPPFIMRRQSEVVHVLQTQQLAFPRRLKITPECKALLCELLEKDPEKRITWDNFFNHPWFNGINFCGNSRLASNSNPQLQSRPNTNPFISDSPVAQKSEFYSACLEIVKLAKQQIPEDSLNIYLKCAQDIKRYLDLKLRYEKLPATEVVQDIRLCKEIFLDILSKIKKLRELGTSVSTKSPDNIIFKHAMKLGERGATKELILLYEKSVGCYYSAICLLKYLRARPCDTNYVQDMLDKVLSRFQRRYTRVQEIRQENRAPSVVRSRSVVQLHTQTK